MKKIILAPLAILLATSVVQADNNATVEVPLSGRMIAALGVTLTNGGVTLPDVASPESGEANAVVTLTCNSDGTSSVTYGGNSNPYAAGTKSATAPNPSSQNLTNNLGNSTGTCAMLNVTGQNGYHYTASMLTPPGFSSPFQQSVIDCNSDTSGAGQIGTTGLYCGATVTITPAANGSAFSYATNSSLGEGVVAVVYH